MLSLIVLLESELGQKRVEQKYHLNKTEDITRVNEESVSRTYKSH